MAITLSSTQLQGRPPLVPDSPLVDVVGHARWYGARRNDPTPRLIVWHTTESPTATVTGTLAYDARRDDTVSCTFFVGDQIGQDVAEASRPYTNGRWNDDSITIEIIATAYWTTEQWAARRVLLDNLVELTADICRRHNIPARWISPEELLAGAAGICDHLTCNQASILEDPSRKGRAGYTHTDVGPGLRALVPGLVARVAEILAPPKPTEPDPVQPDASRPDLMTPQEITMALIDFQPDTAAWVRLAVTDDGRMWHPVSGRIAAVQNAAGIPAVTVDRATLVDHLKELPLVRHQSCPREWRDDGELVMLWVAAGGAPPA